MKWLSVTVAGALLIGVAPCQATVLVHRTPAEMKAFREQAGKGDVQAMIALGDAWHEGLAPGAKGGRKAAIYWYEKAAERGSADAQRKLGDIYADSSVEGVERDEVRALAWYRRAAEKSDVFAQGGLARLYETSSVYADYRQAYTWNLKAALQGDELAIQHLQSMYIYRQDVATFDEAVDRLSKEAAAGSSDAEWRLGYIFRFDDFSRKNKARALELLQQSAARNNAKGLFFLGQLYAWDDDDTLRDEDKGVELFRASAELGYVPAQITWSHYYRSPQGTPRETDPMERVIFDWLAAAAEKGYPQPQLSMSVYCLTGVFAPKDPAEGYKWLLLSNHSPYRRGSFNGWDSEGQLEWEKEGRKRADTWLAAHPKRYWQLDDE